MGLFGTQYSAEKVKNRGKFILLTKCFQSSTRILNVLINETINRTHPGRIRKTGLRGIQL